MEVRYADLARRYARCAQEYDSAVLSVARSGQYVGGARLAEFEKSFAAFYGRPHCAGVNCGLDALALALRALGIGPDDEVIVPANTFIATALAVTACGAVPVFADANEYFGMEPSEIKRLTGPRTRAVIPVHLYGQVCDMDAIMKAAGKAGLTVIEDCAQAHGASLNGRMAGSFGAAACFSFFPSKPLGAFGDAGAVLTSSEETDKHVRRLRNYGSSKKYVHEELGSNSRMDEIQAAVLSVGLRHLEDENALRESVARAYLEGIHNPLIALPKVRPGSAHVWHIFPVLCPRRDELKDYLGGRGIDTIIHYPVPCHLAKCYASLGYKRGSLPNAERFADTELSLPCFAGETDEEIGWVIDALNCFGR